jgi:protein involved in polysaccharide export with SLBB domain
MKLALPDFWRCSHSGITPRSRLFRSVRLFLFIFLFALGQLFPTDAQTRGPAGAAPTVTPGTPIPVERRLENNYKIAIGEDLSFRILEDQDAPVLLHVNEAGQIDVPLVGKVQAASKTPYALALEIKRYLEGSLYKKATVVITAARWDAGASGNWNTGGPARIYVVGEVNQKGPLDLPSDESLTVSRAILRAGGFSDFADTRNVKLIRKNGTLTLTTVVNVPAVVAPGSIERDPVLQPGDVILVPSRMMSR